MKKYFVMKVSKNDWHVMVRESADRYTILQKHSTKKGAQRALKGLN